MVWSLCTQNGVLQNIYQNRILLIYRAWLRRESEINWNVLNQYNEII